MSQRSSNVTNTTPETRRRLVVSFHDLAPPVHKACAECLDTLRAHGVDRTSLLVVPFWKDQGPFDQDAVFTDWLRGLSEQGHEVCLHGYQHTAEQVTGGPVQQWMGRVYTLCEGEFFQLDRAEADRRLQEGRAVFARCGFDPCGFVPPAWLLSPEGRDAVREAGFAYATRLNAIDVFAASRTIYAPTLVVSCRNVWRRAVSQVWVRVWYALNRTQPILRIAIHPADLAFAAVRRTLYALVARAAALREVVTYRDLLASGERLGGRQ